MEQYKEKLEEAKKLYESANDDQKHVLESLFPELKENENEKIRKDIISHLQYLAKYCSESLPDVDKWITWLKKQGESDETKDLKSLLEHVLLYVILMHYE